MVKKYTLMNKDVPVLEIELKEGEFFSYTFTEKKWITPELKPFGYETFSKWLSYRKAPKHRKHIDKIIKELKISGDISFIDVTNAASLNDTYWVKSEETPKTWNEVSLYRNEFDVLISEAALNGVNDSLSFSKTSPELTTDGLFAKCWIKENNGIYLIKRGSETYKREYLCEFYAGQIAEKICANSVKYEVVNFSDNPASKCKAFTTEEIGFVPMYRLTGHVEDEEKIKTCIEKTSELGCEDAFKKMLVLDSLIFNEDRHLGNFGFVYDNDKLKIIDFAPVFDHNRSMFFAANDVELLMNGKNAYRAESRFNVDMNLIAHSMLTPEIKTDLKNLKFFEFEKSEVNDFSDERLKKHEVMLNEQIDKILGNIRMYVPDMGFEVTR